MAFIEFFLSRATYIQQATLIVKKTRLCQYAQVLPHRFSWTFLHCPEISLCSQDPVKITTVECFFYETANLSKEDPYIPKSLTKSFFSERL